MAKTIKFNLICDGKPIRTIEDLQNNFSIEDVLEYYNNQLLHRWLKVRGYSTELEKVSAITSEKKMDIIKELIAIFNITTDMAEIEKDVYMFEYKDERKKAIERYQEEGKKIDNIITEYKKSYQNLISEILENPTDAAKIKANIDIITKNYGWILELNHRELFWNLWFHQHILAIMCLLMNEISRDYYLPKEIKSMYGNISLSGENSENVTKNHHFDTDSNPNKAQMYESICSLTNSVESINDLNDALGTELKFFSGITDGYWKDLEPKGKRYMIINMEPGNYIRPAEQKGGDLSDADIRNKFVILDGIDYKSNNEYDELLYMEV